MTRDRTRPRVVIAGLGDSGLLTAFRLSGFADVVGISAKPALVSGQELGVRLTRPTEWARDYLVPFDRYRGLDGVRTVQARLTGLDLTARAVHARTREGAEVIEPFDALVISTGVRNGFWRRPDLQTAAEIADEVLGEHQKLASARSVAVIGGGAAAVSAAANIAARWPGTRVDLYYPRERPLVEHHPRTWEHLRRRLTRLGVGLHPGHRAVLPAGFDADAITAGPVAFGTGRPPVEADAVLWAIGRVRPNTEWLPPELLDADGFVTVTTELRVPHHRGVFAIGDVAATDPLRSSARNRADGLLSYNIRAELAGRPMRTYRAPRHRWGSVIGAQSDGVEVFAPNGRAFRIPRRAVDAVLMPVIVRRGIYRGVRPNRPLG
ncbi:MAG TPA: FAD-dependent oxidoreductase [Mycobacterium sp.]|nr:FAD-dependent oxidoreductase [Mycobacterium sp.]HPZ93480.1 FAD-dependent oxidoreductase [Mycobacterium sp.]HQE14358.1 FAD-dependent oxidoreductase [Mycobacterium sp.]